MRSVVRLEQSWRDEAEPLLGDNSNATGSTSPTNENVWPHVAIFVVA